MDQPSQCADLLKAHLSQPTTDESVFQELVQWIHEKTGMVFTPDATHIAKVLADGEMLLKLAEASVPEMTAAVRALHSDKVHGGQPAKLQMEKALDSIHVFLKVCRTIGVREEYLVKSADLIEGLDMHCLLQFKRLTHNYPCSFSIVRVRPEFGSHPMTGLSKDTYNSGSVSKMQKPDDVKAIANKSPPKAVNGQGSCWTAQACSPDNICSKYSSISYVALPFKEPAHSACELRATEQSDLQSSMDPTVRAKYGWTLPTGATTRERSLCNENPSLTGQLLLQQHSDDNFMVKSRQKRLTVEDAATKELMEELKALNHREKALQDEETRLLPTLTTFRGLLRQLSRQQKAMSSMQAFIETVQSESDRMKEDLSLALKQISVMAEDQGEVRSVLQW